MEAGEVKIWLDQGPATLLEKTDIQDPLTLEEASVDGVVPTYSPGWVIHLLETGEVLSVHEDTLEDFNEEN